MFIVDDDENVRNALRLALQEDGRMAEAYNDSEAFLEAYMPGKVGCLLVDANLPGMSGLDLLRHLRLAGDALPSVIITGNSDVPMAVQAMKAGADDFVAKPVGYQELLNAIDKAVEHSLDGAQACGVAGGSSAPYRRSHPRASARSWIWFLPASRARTSPPILVSASARWKITAPPS